MKAETKTKTTTPENSFGVVLIAFNHAYFHKAYNLAFSIHYFNPDIKITVHVDSVYDFNIALADWKSKEFDQVVEHKEYFRDFAEVKLNIDRFAVYDRSLYLDVDTICLKDIAPLFEQLKDSDYKTEVNTDFMLWATREQTEKHYGFTPDDYIPSTNSSVQYIAKGGTATKIFDAARAAHSNPIPVKELYNTWGGTQPDELYLNVGIAKNRFDAAFEKGPVFFTTKISHEYEKLKDFYYFLSYFGPRGHTPYYYTNYMDVELKRMQQERGQRHTNESRVSNLINFKYANKRRK